MFLVEKPIPAHIRSLPQKVLDTPFGRNLKAQLDQQMRGITQAPLAYPVVPQAGTPRQVTNGYSAPSINGAGQTSSIGRVHNVTRLPELDHLLSAAKKSCAVIFFTSATCPPCKLVYPAYDELAAEAGDKATLIKVDTSMAFEIARKYNIRVTPTFMTFLHGEKADEWTGAHENQLRNNVRMLQQMAHPPHPHINLKLPTLQRRHKYVLYAKVPPLDKIIGKLGSVSSDPSVIALKDFITARNTEPAADAPLPFLPEVNTFVLKSLQTVPSDTLFPLIDLLRLALVDPRVSGFYAEERSHDTILRILSHVNALGDKCPYTLRIVTLQMACNLFSSPLYPSQLLSNPKLSSPLIDLLTSSLLDSAHAPVRVSAASLAFNIAATNHIQRLEEGKEDSLPESAQVELAASLVEAIERENDSKEGLKGLVFALGLLAYGSSREGELKDVLEALEAKRTVDGKSKLLRDEQKLVKEVLQVL